MNNRQAEQMLIADWTARAEVHRNVAAVKHKYKIGVRYGIDAGESMAISGVVIFFMRPDNLSGAFFTFMLGLAMILVFALWFTNFSSAEASEIAAAETYEGLIAERTDDMRATSTEIVLPSK